MKVEKAETKFTPVVITLESQEEVDQMFALVNCVSVRSQADITWPLHEALEHLYEDGDKYSLEGSVLIKS